MTQNEFMTKIIDKANLVNEETINFKEYDYRNILETIKIICKSIECIPEIVFEGIELIDDEFQINKMQRNIPIENSRVMKIKIHFKLVDENGNLYLDEKTGKELRPTIDLLIPRLINGTFLLNDVLYYPMLQILDYKSILKKDSVIIKTLINKLRMTIKKNKRKIRRVGLDLFRKKDLQIWVVLLSIYNPIDAICRVFKVRPEDISINDGIIDSSDDYFINVLDQHIVIKNIPKNDQNQFSIDVMKESLLELFNDKNNIKFLNKLKAKYDTKLDFINSSDIYIELLGSFYATNQNKYYDKGKNVCSSISRFLDEISKKYLQVDDLLEMFMNELERINLHNIALESFDEETLELNNANNLLNKRVCMTEYVIYPFTKKLSENLHSVLNGNTKDNIKINKILNIFKIDHHIIMNEIVKNNLVRYCDQTNQMSAISKSKASFISGSSSASNIPTELKSVPRSGINRIDLITTSTGESIGTTFSLSATNKALFDHNGIII